MKEERLSKMLMQCVTNLLEWNIISRSEANNFWLRIDNME